MASTFQGTITCPNDGNTIKYRFSTEQSHKTKLTAKEVMSAAALVEARAVADNWDVVPPEMHMGPPPLPKKEGGEVAALTPAQKRTAASKAKKAEKEKAQAETAAKRVEGSEFKGEGEEACVHAHLFLL